MQKFIMTMLLLAGAMICRGTTYYVATNGVDNTDVGRGLSWNLPYATISNGVAKATADNDLVLVSNGVYVLTSQVSIAAAITLRGLDRTNTILRGDFPMFTNRALYINNAGATVAEFTVTQFGLPTNSLDLKGCGGAIYINNGTVQACIISNNIGSYAGGGIYQAAGLISNCVIRGNTCRAYSDQVFGGGGIYAMAQVRNCGIFDNVCTNVDAAARSWAGGVLLSGATAMLADCVVSNNTAYYHGGGVYLNNGLVLNSTIANNTCIGYYGGGVVWPTGTGTLNNTFIRNNTASSYGGGMYAYGNAPKQILNCEISGNTSDARGGGIAYHSASTLLMTNCVISSNTAVSGGGICTYITVSMLSLTAQWCRITDNYAQQYGGGLYLAWTGVLEHCTISGNAASNNNSYGGGIFLRGGAGYRLRNCQITGNTVRKSDAGLDAGGGIYIAANAGNTFESCTIAGNTASSAGGGLFLDGDGGDSFSNCIIYANILTNAGATSSNVFMTTAARSNAFYYSCSDCLDNSAQGNCASDPLFLDTEGGNYRLQNNSPCLNAGKDQLWMEKDTDLDGRHRIDRFIRRVDLGCFEHTPHGALYMLR